MINDTELEDYKIKIILRRFDLKPDMVKRVYTTKDGNLVILQGGHQIPIEIPYRGGIGKIKEEEYKE